MMKYMQFIKMHGLGNDFVIVDLLTKKQNIFKDLGKAAVSVCERNFGIGADGLVFILPSDKADIKMRIFNSDGSEAEMCGNVIRCVARYVYDMNIMKNNRISVETLAGIMVPEIIFDDKNKAVVRVNMGKPILDPAKVPVKITENDLDGIVNEKLKVDEREFSITCVSMGNPHCVIFVSDLEIEEVVDWGPKIETHAVFPKKTNVEFVKILNGNEVKMQVWERGAGLTLACGTGACAAAVAAVLNGLTNKKVQVHLSVGSLLVEWASDGNVYMTGPAEYVYFGELHEEFLQNIT